MGPGDLRVAVERLPSARHRLARPLVDRELEIVAGRADRAFGPDDLDVPARAAQLRARDAEEELVLLEG